MGDLVARVMRGMAHVAHAATIEEGTTAARLEPPAVVLLDLSLGDVDALDRLADLRAEPALAAVPIIGFSVHDSRRAEAMATGQIADFIAKPFSPQVLRDRLQPFLEAGDASALQDELRELKANKTLLEQQIAVYAKELRELYERDRAPIHDHRERTARVRSAMNEGLSIVFQPIRELASGRIVGAEALARFTAQPVRPPNEWFAEAAACGIGPELELAAIERAVASIDGLPPATYLSLNVSPDVIVSPGWDAPLARADPERIVIEVTEHAPVHDYRALAEGLGPLRKRGARLAVDDAGAGFASLRHILSLAPDIIKLDVSLTRGMASDAGRRALAAALISFAQGIAAVIVAEGVETEAESHALRMLGVSLGQGYHLGRPSPLPLG